MPEASPELASELSALEVLSVRDVLAVVELVDDVDGSVELELDVASVVLVSFDPAGSLHAAIATIEIDTHLRCVGASTLGRSCLTGGRSRRWSTEAAPRGEQDTQSADRTPRVRCTLVELGVACIAVKHSRTRCVASRPCVQHRPRARVSPHDRARPLSASVV